MTGSFVTIYLLVADEAEGDKAKEKILNKAKEEVESKISDEIEEKLKKDPVGYLTDETGIYTVEELAKQNFMSIDYDLCIRCGQAFFVKVDNLAAFDTEQRAQKEAGDIGYPRKR
jgi:hypothetical protein